MEQGQAIPPETIGHIAQIHTKMLLLQSIQSAYASTIDFSHIKTAATLVVNHHYFYGGHGYHFLSHLYADVKKIFSSLLINILFKYVFCNAFFIIFCLTNLFYLFIFGVTISFHCIFGRNNFFILVPKTTFSVTVFSQKQSMCASPNK